MPPTRRHTRRDSSRRGARRGSLATPPTRRHTRRGSSRRGARRGSLEREGSSDSWPPATPPTRRHWGAAWKGDIPEPPERRAQPHLQHEAGEKREARHELRCNSIPQSGLWSHRLRSPGGRGRCGRAEATAEHRRQADEAIAHRALLPRTVASNSNNGADAQILHGEERTGAAEGLAQ